MNLYINIVVIQVIEFVVVLSILIFIMNLKVSTNRLRIFLAIIIFFPSFLLARYMKTGGDGVIGLVVQIICINIIFTDKRIKKNSRYFVTYLGSGLINLFVKLLIMIVLGVTFSSIEYSIFYAIVADSITCIIIFIPFSILKLMKGKKSRNIEAFSTINVILFCFAALSCSFVFSFYSAWRDNEISEKWNAGMINNIMILSITFVTVAMGFIWKNSLSEHYKNENRIKAELIDLQETYYVKILENNEDIRKFKHDLKAHMICLKEMACNEKYDELKEYLSEVEDSVDILYDKITVGNEVVNIVLNSSYEEALQNKIEFNCKGEFRGDILMPSSELCVLFYNLVKNAMEACAKIALGERKISLEIKSYKNNLVIDICNSVANSVNIEQIDINGTTKEDKINHGYGLKIIKRIVNKYDGTVNYKNDEGLFTVVLILNNVYV